MWDDRASRLRREIIQLAAAGFGVSELHAAAIELVSRTVSTELTCWASIDPETQVISSMVSGENRIPIEYEPRLAEAEYSMDEPHTFAALARRGITLARLSDLAADDRWRSTRLHSIWRPLGMDEELRVMFRTDGVCWGAAGLVRSGIEFTAREVEFLAAIAPAIGSATRLAVRSEAKGGTGRGRPALVIIAADGRLVGVTPDARDWQERLDAIAPGRFQVMMQVMASGSHAAEAGYFRARLRDADGRWAVLQASTLIGGEEDQVAVAIEPVTGDQLVGLLLLAYDLSAREREICREVIGGYSTAEIASHLFISVHTVQDHLKSVFAKVGVRSRGELVARLRPGNPDGYATTDLQFARL
ncbi:helix-turn-helix transcriptional regulator [Arthrobacter sp. MSA 4-2]|uniref:response regulator transcription factor n=1 Tax=Arthrobacter sp. MSA 4-2 TaxID=2794349 RepID=UPI0018E7DA5C|nr:helix-turn-helix transcriptional regulator [Arthrobacter sp. MSA 4-2]MBJ2121511.1 helix-turn-helix transcriptional regulator [Arthrobacter sp. MSA 4-2]